MEQLDERCVLKIALIMVRIKRDQLYSHRAANGERKRDAFQIDQVRTGSSSFFLSVSLLLFLLRWLALRCRRRRVSFASTKQTLAPQIARAKSPLAAADVCRRPSGSDYSNVQRVRQFANAKTHTRSSA
jgi:hypothetical protein